MRNIFCWFFLLKSFFIRLFIVWLTTNISSQAIPCLLTAPLIRSAVLTAGSAELVQQGILTRAFTGFWPSIRHIWRYDGFKGFWRGSFINVLRIVPIQIAQLGLSLALCAPYMRPHDSYEAHKFLQYAQLADRIVPVVASGLLYPFNMIHVRMSCDTRSRIAPKRLFRNSFEVFNYTSTLQRTSVHFSRLLQENSEALRNCGAVHRLISCCGI